MAQLLPNGNQQFLDANGNPLVGGLVYFYIPNTTTPKDTWQDAAGTILNTNPVVCDARGQATIYGYGSYRQILKDAFGNVIWDKDVAPAGMSFATFAQIDALTSDQGPIICTDMAGVLYVWTSSTYFTGYRSVFCGKVEGGWTSTPFAWQKLATGGTWSDSDTKLKRLIARYQESAAVVTPANWKKGQNMIADLGSGDWKAPDLQDMFVRFTGTDADTANARALGSAQLDAIQNIVGQINTSAQMGVGTGPFGSTITDNYNSGTQVAGVDTVTFDASRTVRTSTETRGLNTALAPMIWL